MAEIYQKEIKYWPAPNSYSRNIPINGPGSFAEDRGDRHHCGVDIYAPSGSDIVSIEKGIAIDIGIMTDPKIHSYWNTTYFVAIKNEERGIICKYCEMLDVVIRVGDKVEAGQLVGHVGTVLNFDNIDEYSPSYIQKVKENGNSSMLHFELYKDGIEVDGYSGGNWFDKEKPENLLDPSELLRSLVGSGL